MSRKNSPYVSLNDALMHMRQRLGVIMPALRMGQVCRIEIPVIPVNELQWLRAQQLTPKLYGANQKHNMSIAGVGVAKLIAGSSSINLAKVLKEMRQHLSPAYPNMQWYGGFAFDGASVSSTWKDFGSYRFMIPQFELASKGAAMIFCCNLFGPYSSREIKKVFDQLDTLVMSLADKSMGEVDLKLSSRQDFPHLRQWQQGVSKALLTINQGDLAKVVLARQTVCRLRKTVNPWDLMQHVLDLTPHSYHFCFEFGRSTFLGASPERLYKRQGHLIETEALAGTIKRGMGVSQDVRQRHQLKTSDKNNREHQFVVRAIHDVFKKMGVKVSVDKHPQLLTLANGHHLITHFKAKTAKVLDSEFIQHLHPTPAVGGWPTKAALRFIKEHEVFDRGWYTGSIGYVGLGVCEFVVSIRCALLQGKKLSLYAGAGLVEGSESQDEWQEIENKISNFSTLIRS